MIPSHFVSVSRALVLSFVLPLALALTTVPAFITSAHAFESDVASIHVPDDVEVVVPDRVDRPSLSRILHASHEPPLSGEMWRMLGVDVEDALIEIVRNRSLIFGARIRAMHALAELRSEPGRRVLVEFAESEAAPEELRDAAKEALTKFK